MTKEHHSPLRQLADSMQKDLTWFGGLNAITGTFTCVASNKREYIATIVSLDCCTILCRERPTIQELMDNHTAEDSLKREIAYRVNESRNRAVTTALAAENLLRSAP